MTYRPTAQARLQHFVDVLPIFNGAVCTQTDPDIWVPEHESTDLHTIKQAKHVCVGCPARTACLHHALTHGEVGIWGGTTTSERRAMRQAGAA